MTNPINDIFTNIFAVLSEGLTIVGNFLLDYMFLLIAIGCWIRFCSQLFLRGNFSTLLLLFAVVTTVAAVTMGQIPWTGPLITIN